MSATITWPQGKIDNSDVYISHFHFVDKISEAYVLKVFCHGAANAALPQAFDPVTFSFNNNKMSGLLLTCSYEEDKIKNRWNYILEIRPRLYILALSRTIKLYPNASVVSIIKDLLTQARTALNGRDLPYENLVTNGLFTTAFKRLEISYDSTDLNYLQALCQYGIRFCFEEKEAGEQILLIDAPYKLPYHEQSLRLMPDKKEDIHQDEPSIYRLIQRKKLVCAQGCATYYDPLSVDKSLANIIQGTQTPNDKIVDQSGITTLYQSPCYSPPALQNIMSDNTNQLLHSDEHEYELHSYYSGLRAGQQVQLEEIKGFIESVNLMGQFEHGAWRFDSIAKFRSLSDISWLGQFKKRLALPATLTGAEIQADEQVNDLGEFKVKFPLRFITDANNEPWVSLRDLQTTSTDAGGTSHSMSASAEVLIASENGAPYDWMILGSLDNNERPSLITSDNYRESRMSTSGGMNIHLRRQDTSNPYSEINMGLKDSQNNRAATNLGTSMSAMQENSEQHGIQEISSGYGKRAIMGNYYDTVGDPEDPLHQVSLVQNQDSGMSILKRQTNVSKNGTYTKKYYTTPAGAQIIYP